MIDSNVISLILNSLESTGASNKSTIEELIKLIVEVSHESEDLKDELNLYEDMFFHIYIYDIECNIWMKKVGAQLTYNTSYYENVPEEMKIIHFILSKKVFKRIFTQRLDSTDAFMRGLIKIQGNLPDAVITRNLLKTFFQYINYYLAYQT